MKGEERDAGGEGEAGKNRTRKRHFANMASHLAMRRVRTWRGRGWNITVLSIELRFSTYGDRDVLLTPPQNTRFLIFPLFITYRNILRNFLSSSSFLFFFLLKNIF